ncbi:hypothetical protein F5X98DRAFT_347830 [Xylaria grammica]|nr:hypothetical protein F5X98DRAFT_347830 [Xylaria grammica]
MHKVLDPLSALSVSLSLSHPLLARKLALSGGGLCTLSSVPPVDCKMDCNGLSVYYHHTPAPTRPCHPIISSSFYTFGCSFLKKKKKKKRHARCEPVRQLLA